MPYIHRFQASLGATSSLATLIAGVSLMDGETVETVSDCILGGSKVTADGDCNHEIKRHLLLGGKVPRASVRNSTHGKGHEEGSLAYAKAWSSLRKPPVPEHLPPNQSVLCSHLHLWLYGGLSPITISLREGVNLQLQVNKNSWAWQECFSLRTPLKVI